MPELNYKIVFQIGVSPMLLRTPLHENQSKWKEFHGVGWEVSTEFLFADIKHFHYKMLQF